MSENPAPAVPNGEEPQPSSVDSPQNGMPQYNPPAEPYQQPLQDAQPQGAPAQGYQQPYGQQPYAQQPYGQQPYAQPYAPEQKSKLAAGLLGILLGYLGIHNFYLGNIQRACIQLGLTVVLGWFFGLGVLVAGIWGLVEGILILTGSPSYRTDAKGIPLKE